MLALNVRKLPLAMESQINNQKTGDWLMANNNQKSKASRTQSWRYLDKLVATQCYLQVRSFTVLHCRLFVHLRPWSLVAVPNLQFLQSLLCSRDLVSNGPNERHRLKEQFWITLGPCHYNFNSGIRAIGKTRVATCHINLEMVGQAGSYLQRHSFTVLHCRFCA